MSVKQKLRGITPLFQKVLVEQIGRLITAFSERDLDQAFWDLTILVSALKEKDRTPLKQNDILHVKKLLQKARTPKSSSFYRGLIESSASQEAILAENLRNVFEKLMDVLHEGGYLEIISKTPRFFEPGIKAEQIE